MSHENYRGDCRDISKSVPTEYTKNCVRLPLRACTLCTLLEYCRVSDKSTQFFVYNRTSSKS